MRARSSGTKRISFKKRVIVWLLLVLITLGLGSSYMAVSSSLPVIKTNTFTTTKLPAEDVPLAWPAVGQAAIGTLNTGVLATSSDEEVTKPIASIAKIVTALAVLQQKPLGLNEPGATLKLDATDVDYYASYHSKGGSVVRVAIDEEITQYDALEALLIPSANNIADSLVRWAFGSMEAYKIYSNNMVKEFGLNKTVIDDASGFSASTVSTPSELIVLGQKALQNPVIAEIVAKKEAVVPVAGTIKNVNSLLLDGRIVGIKTGTTDEAGGCLLFASKFAFDSSNSVTIIGVVMGTPSPTAAFQASRALLDTTYAGFATDEIIKPGDKVGSYTSAWGQTTNLVAKEALIAHRWKGESLQTEVLIDQAYAPIQTDQKVGVIKLTDTLGSKSVDVTVKNAITKPSFVWRLSHLF